MDTLDWFTVYTVLITRLAIPFVSTRIYRLNIVVAPFYCLRPFPCTSGLFRSVLDGGKGLTVVHVVYIGALVVTISGAGIVLLSVAIVVVLVWGL